MLTVTTIYGWVAEPLGDAGVPVEVCARSGFALAPVTRIPAWAYAYIFGDEVTPSANVADLCAAARRHGAAALGGAYALGGLRALTALIGGARRGE